MSEFKMYSDLLFFDTFREFCASETFTESDHILTSKSIYTKFIEPLCLPCGVTFIRDYIHGEPSTDAVDALRSALPSGITRMIAIGGGTVMDTAKMLSLHTSSNTTEALFSLDPNAEKPTLLFDVYAIPTTCGTGSEVTNACAVELVSLHTKRGLNSPLMYPKKAILIPELIYDLPYKFFATSSIDALIHAAESYLSPKATPVSELFSEQAMTMIIEGYRYVIEHGAEHWIDRAK